jgi:hypothetical protein
MTSARVTVIKSSLAFSVSVALIVVLGCGDESGLAKRYPVKGTVTYKNQPVAKGQINFIPEDSKTGRGANGDIVDGSYFLTTAVNGDGALPGKYKVTISALDYELPPEAKTKGSGGQAFAQSPAAAEARKKAKALVPPKYGSVDKTDLGAEVEAKPNKIDFTLED